MTTPGDKVGLAIVVLALIGGIRDLIKFIKIIKADEKPGERMLENYAIWAFVWAWICKLGTLISLRF